MKTKRGVAVGRVRYGDFLELIGESPVEPWPVRARDVTGDSLLAGVAGSNAEDGEEVVVIVELTIVEARQLTRPTRRDSVT